MDKSTEHGSIQLNRVTYFRIAVMAVCILMLSFIMAFGILLGISSFKHNAPVEIGDEATTVRKALPSSGAQAASASPLDTIGYLAYVLDAQQAYHVYAYNSTKSTGYEQVTQSWKDYKSAQASGTGLSVMVCSDLSYSALVKSASQSCFIGGNEALMRSGNKPAKSSTPVDIEWAQDKPVVYDKEGYKYAYGEFSTEISVYVINEQTIISADDTIDNGDGTFSRKYYLNEKAGCWYQYGMKTRGGLKNFPEFQKIDITFKFDAKWRVLESYCEEKTLISPRALGGMSMDSTAKTTTEYSYGEDNVDNGHYGYYENFFKKYEGSTPNQNSPAEKTELGVLDVLGGGFNKVIESGQQFKAALTLGETVYDAKIYLKLADMSDAIGTLEARVAIEKQNSGKQDLYVEFKKGRISVYYSSEFALTADIDELSQSVTKIGELISGIGSNGEIAPPEAAGYAADGGSGGLDLASLINDLKLEIKDDEAFIVLQSENLLGLGLGIDAVIGFDRTADGDGDIFAVKSLNLNCVKYNGTIIDVKAEIVPDDGEIIQRNEAQTPANLKDYVDSVYAIFNSKTIRANIALDDKLVEGLTLDAQAYVMIASPIAAKVDIAAEYKGVTLKLSANYILEKGTYGKLYLHVTEINGQAVNAKIYCDIKDTLNTVREIIALLNKSEQNGASEGMGVDSAGDIVAEAQDKLASIVNKVINLNYSQIIGNVRGNADSISLDVNIDELLKGLDISIGLELGTAALAVDRVNSQIFGEFPSLGLRIGIIGSQEALPAIEDIQNYVDVLAYVKGLISLYTKPAYNVTVELAGTKITDKIDLSGLSLLSNAIVAIDGTTIRVSAPISVSYNEYGAELTARYTINLNDGSYGRVYIDITKVTGPDGKQIELDAKVYCDIKQVADSVKSIIEKLTSKGDVAQPDEQASAQAESASVISKAIEVVLSLDINEAIKANNEKLNIKVNVDEILGKLEITLGGISFGEIELEYSNASHSLNGSLPKLGVKVEVSGRERELEAFDGTGYIDVLPYIESIGKLIDAKAYKIDLAFNGTKITDEIDLSGITANATIYACLENNYRNIKVNAFVQVEYFDLTAEFNVYYTIDIGDGSYGKVYLELTKVNQTSLSAKVYCDIRDAAEGIKSLLACFKPQNGAAQGTPAQSAASTDLASKLVNLAFGLDYNQIIKATQNNVNVKLNVDDVLGTLGVDVGVVFGELDLALNIIDGAAELNGRLDKLGISASLKDCNYSMPAIDGNKYLNLTDAIALIESAINQVKDIERTKDVAFGLNGSFVADDVSAQIVGSGEIDFASDIKVALSLTLTVDGRTVEINLIYDGAVAGDEPCVILTVNQAGVKIHARDIDKLTDSISDLIGAFTGGSAVAEPQASGYAMAVGDYSVEELLRSDNVKKAINAVLGFAGKLTVELKNADGVKSLLINHASGVSLTFGTDGGLNLSIKNGDKLDLSASVAVGNGAVAGDIANKLADQRSESNPEGKYTYYDIDGFVKKLYGDAFDRIESGSLKKLIGDNPYLLSFKLSGANSGFMALDGVDIAAELYYDEGVLGTVRGTKLLAVDLKLNINGTFASANAAYCGRTLFMELTKVGGTSYTGIKFKADVTDLFDAVHQLVRLITDTDAVAMLSRLTGKQSPKPAEIENIAAFAREEANVSALTKIIDALLTLDLDKAFSYDKSSGSIKIDLDEFTGAVFGFEIGAIDASLNREQKTISASVAKQNGASWLELSGAPCAKRENVINSDDYVDVSFISTLVGDAIKTITDDSGHVYDLYTFVGAISFNVKDIPVLGKLSVNFKNATITFGFDSRGKSYFTLAASLQKTTAVGYTVTASRDISVTYSEGLIVLGRDIGTNGESYRVLTMEYFLDNMLDKNDSPVRWLLGTSDFAWDMLVQNLKINLDSGLTKPKEYVLFGDLNQGIKESKFHLTDYILGMEVKADSQEPLSVYGNGGELAKNKFDLYQDANHYAFDINAGRLTNGTVTALCAAILRNDRGISGIKAYGEMGPMVDFTLDFGTYLEGETEVYGGYSYAVTEVSVSENDFYTDYREVEAGTVTNENFGSYFEYRDGEYVLASEYVEGATYFKKVNTQYYIAAGGDYSLATVYDANERYYKYVSTANGKALGSVAARNYLAYVIEKYGFDKNHVFANDNGYISKIFGCFKTAENEYLSSDVLATIYLDIYADRQATVPEKTINVLYGSVIHTIRDFPEFANEEKTAKLVYVTADGTLLNKTLVIGEKLSSTPVGDDFDAVQVDYVNGVGRVSLYKSSLTAIEVIFDFGNVGGIKPLSSALSNGDSLVEYPINDYTFLGWYKEASFTNRVTKVNAASAVDGKITLYGKYVRAFVESQNGVNYSFDISADAYFVSGVNGNIAQYYAGGAKANEWLEIADAVYGYPVKYIATGAFKNDYDDTAHSLVKVLVPQTVTAVYDEAFKGNRALREAVFFADKVFFGGRANGDGQTSVFYGCYTSISGNVNPSFTVYYNGTMQYNPNSHVSTVNRYIDSEWNRIYFNKSGNKTIYYAVAKAGGWAFVEFETAIVNFDASTVLPDGVNLNSIICDGITFTGYEQAEKLANAIGDLLMAQIGRNIYGVEASSALPLNGKRHSIAITITEHEEIKPASEMSFIVKFGSQVLLDGEVRSVDENANLEAIYGELDFSGKSGYTFMGWYKDESLTQPAPLTNNGTVAMLYARLVPNEYTAANGVTYRIIQGTTPVSYMVWYWAMGSDGVDYTQADAWLILDNELFGIPVTKINEWALEKKNLKNVVVPSNINIIGYGAFYANYGMLNAVFLAEDVTMYGDVGTKNYLPFYDCSTGKGSKQTNLNVYYNSISPERWNHFSEGDNYIGVGNAGGSTAAQGWGYASFTLTDGYNLGDFGYCNGLIKNTIDHKYLSDIKAKIMAVLNERTAGDGVINGYAVTVTDNLVNGIHNIKIAIAQDAANAWNKLEIAGNIQIELNADIQVLNGSYFVRRGATVTVKAVSGEEGLTRIVISSANATVLYDSGKVAVSASLSFAMPAEFASVAGECESLPITEITLKSAVAVSGYAYNAANAMYEMTGVPVGEDKAMPSQVTSLGYVFLGWAYENSCNMLEFENSVTHRVYYAIWAYEKAELNAYRIENGNFAADVDGTKAAWIYGWYRYDLSSEQADYNAPLSANGLTAQTTIVYTRMVYNMNYHMSSNMGGTNYYYVNKDADNSNEKSGGSHSGSFTMIEGTQLVYRWKDATDSTVDVDKVLELTFVNAWNVTETLCFRIKNKPKSSISDWNPRTTTVGFNLTGAITNGDVPSVKGPTGNKLVDGNMDLRITAK